MCESIRHFLNNLVYKINKFMFVMKMTVFYETNYFNRNVSCPGRLDQ